jgi:SAM-dependent methyltransferase
MENQINSGDRVDFLNRIFEVISGYQISGRYREQMKIKEKSYIYGEARIEEFTKVLALCGNNSDKIFYDLGSGTGKTCFTATFLGGFKKAIGIEIILDLYLTAKKLQNEVPKTYRQYADKLEFINGDITKENFLNGDVIFINSTCYEDYIFNNLVEKFHQLKPGSHVIMTTRKMKTDDFELIYDSDEIEYSWGNPTTRIYRKIT